MSSLLVNTYRNVVDVEGVRQLTNDDNDDQQRHERPVDQPHRPVHPIPLFFTFTYSSSTVRSACVMQSLVRARASPALARYFVRERQS